jgi:hypothetical protein
MPFLYGNHVVKAHLGRITEDTPEHQGVVVFSMKDIPLVRTLSQNNPGRPTDIFRVGLRSDCTINGRHTKTRPDVYYSVPPSVGHRQSFVCLIIHNECVYRDVGEYLRDEVSLFNFSDVEFTDP